MNSSAQKVLTIGVDEGDDVVVELVDETLDGGVAVDVAADQLPGQVLNSLRDMSALIPLLKDEDDSQEQQSTREHERSRATR